jgi:hypothetical protein
MSAHCKAIANAGRPPALLKPQHVATSQLKNQPARSIRNQPQPVSQVTQMKVVRTSPVINSPTPKPTPVVQRMQEDKAPKSPGARIMERMLTLPEFRQKLNLSDLDALRRVDKETRATVDSRFANPGQWAVLHRMHTHSFGEFVESSLPNEDPDKAKRAYENTTAKYNPLAYGKKHTWMSNLHWLRDVNRTFSHLVVTDLPLSESNVKRQSEHSSGQKRNDFSAYARELAYALLHGYSTTDPQPNFTYGELMVQSLHKPEQRIALNSKQKYVLKSVVGNNRVTLDEVLLTFAELGVGVDKDRLLQARDTIAKISYDQEIARLNRYLKASRNDKRWSKTNIHEDPQQWPRDFLRSALEAMLLRSLRNQEIKMWRVQLHEWYKQGLLK